MSRKRKTDGQPVRHVKHEQEPAMTGVSGLNEVTYARDAHSHVQSYWREIALIVVGAIIGSVPMILNSKFQARMQLDQFLLDRQLNALKEYSGSLNQLGRASLAKTQAVLFKVRELRMESHSREITNEELLEITNNEIELFTKAHEFAANMEMNRIVVYAVFGRERESVTPSTIDESIGSDDISNTVAQAPTVDGKLHLLEIEIQRQEEEIRGAISDGNAEMHELAKTIRRPL